MSENKKDFTAVILNIVVFLVVTPCSLGSGDQCFGGIFCSSIKEARDNAFLRNVRIHEQPRSSPNCTRRRENDHGFTA
jgi:hypothetical protein